MGSALIPGSRSPGCSGTRRHRGPGASALPTLPFMALLQPKPKHGNGAGASPGLALKVPQTPPARAAPLRVTAESSVSQHPNYRGPQELSSSSRSFCPLHPPSLPPAAPILPRTALHPCLVLQPVQVSPLSPPNRGVPADPGAAQHSWHQPGHTEPCVCSQRCHRAQKQGANWQCQPWEPPLSVPTHRVCQKPSDSIDPSVSPPGVAPATAGLQQLLSSLPAPSRLEVALQAVTQVTCVPTGRAEAQESGYRGRKGGRSRNGESETALGDTRAPDVPSSTRNTNCLCHISWLQAVNPRGSGQPWCLQ